MRHALGKKGATAIRLIRETDVPSRFYGEATAVATALVVGLQHRGIASAQDKQIPHR